MSGVVSPLWVPLSRRTSWVGYRGSPADAIWLDHQAWREPASSHIFNEREIEEGEEDGVLDHSTALSNDLYFTHVGYWPELQEEHLFHSTFYMRRVWLIKIWIMFQISTDALGFFLTSLHCVWKLGNKHHKSSGSFMIKTETSGSDGQSISKGIVMYTPLSKGRHTDR